MRPAQLIAKTAIGNWSKTALICFLVLAVAAELNAQCKCCPDSKDQSTCQKNTIGDWQINSQASTEDRFAMIPLLNFLSTDSKARNDKQERQADVIPSRDHNQLAGQEHLEGQGNETGPGHLLPSLAFVDTACPVSQYNGHSSCCDELAHQLVQAVYDSGQDKDHATQLVKALLQQSFDNTQLSHQLQMAELKTKHVQELAAIREARMQQNHQHMESHLQSQLSPIVTQQHQTQQSLRAVESRLFELQQKVHRMQQQASEKSSFKLAGESKSRFGNCPDCRQDFVLTGVPTGNKNFKQQMVCGCKPQPHVPVKKTYQPTTHELQLRIVELEQQLAKTRQGVTRQANYEYPAYQPTPLVPAKNNQPLMPIPGPETKNSSKNNTPLPMSYIPRTDVNKSSDHSWVSRVYYVGDLLQYPNSASAQKLARIIRVLIEPQSWDEESAKISFFPSTHSLHIVQTHSNHQEIAELIDLWRKSAIKIGKNHQVPLRY